LFSRFFTRSGGSEDTSNAPNKPYGVDTISASGEIKYRRVSELTGSEAQSPLQSKVAGYYGGDHKSIPELSSDSPAAELYSPPLLELDGTGKKPNYFATDAKPRRRGATRDFIAVTPDTPIAEVNSPAEASLTDGIGPQNPDFSRSIIRDPVYPAYWAKGELAEPDSAYGTVEHSNATQQSEDKSSASSLRISAKKALQDEYQYGNIPEIHIGVREHDMGNLREPSILTHARGLLETDWTQVRDLLPESWKWDVEYRASCWSCTPLEPQAPENYPLEIAGSPVVLPVEHRWPPMGGVDPPPDPRLTAPIDCRAALSMDVVYDVFLTFEGSVGFYLLISGLLQIIVPENFDVEWAASHLPHWYGGLKVCYIEQTLEPTMSPLSAIAKPHSKSTLSFKGSDIYSIFKASHSSSDKLGLPLTLNGYIEARPNGTRRKEKYAARIGLQVAKAGEPYLVMSTHVITQAILAKSHRISIFHRSRSRFGKLDDDWNEHVSIWADNERIGTIGKSFDEEAEIYPNGFRHDVTLIKPSSAASTKELKSPISDMGWINRESWGSLRQQTSLVKVLGATEAHRSAKSVKSSRPSEIMVIGEGVFLNQTATAGVSKSLKDHDRSKWDSLVSRALLYRVYPDFDQPNGYSGVALYADGTRQDGTTGPGIVGFQSFVQRSGHVQSFNMEGPALYRRLQSGRVAFYGAFEVPGELKRDYTIV